MIRRIMYRFSRWEKIALVSLLTLFLVSGGAIISAFWVDNTDIHPAEGGQFIEGTIGQFDPSFNMNPLVIFGKKSNSVEADLAKLIFAGLMRFNAETGEYEDYLADHILSEDKKVYTFRLKEGLKWHDGTPITSDDIIFTFRDVIQHPNFNNEFLKASFDGIIIEKIDDRTVTFELVQPYKFFLTNFTVGIVPKHLLQTVPVDNLALETSFNQSPIGAGPFKFNQVSTADGRFDEIRVSAFDSFVFGKPNINSINIRLYHNISDLIASLDELDGIRPMLKTDSEMLPSSARPIVKTFHLPQYVAAFINMDKEIFKGEKMAKMRWALQLATDKEEILKKIPGIRVDTPLLELDQESWLAEYDPEKAAGGLKDSGWYLPDAIPTEDEEGGTEPTVEAETPVEEHEAASDIWITEPSSKELFDTTNPAFYIVGNVPEGTKKVKVNNYQLQLFDPNKGTFSYSASVEIGTMKYGSNTYDVNFFDETGNAIGNDSITINLSKAESDVEESVSEEILPAPQEEVTVTTEETPTEETPTEETPEEAITETVGDADNEVIAEGDEEIAAEEDKNLPPIRVSKDGKPLEISLVTAKSPSYYPKVAEILKQQWRKIGIDVKVEVLETDGLLQKINARDYDILLFGQNLGYNPDAFGYWHLSQVKTGLNLSEYKSLEASVLLEEIRRTHDEELRHESLEKLQKIITNDVPAVFLFSPDYVLMMDTKKVKNVELNKLAFFRDRFSTVEKWHIRSKRSFKDEKSWFSIIPWSWQQIF